jgi:L-amino acid N-acyltransferase YncA
MEKRASFLILALPRSRTFWLSRFLQYGEWTCGHDEARHVRSMDDVRSWFSQSGVGSVETAAAPFWRLVPSGVRMVVVRRPVNDVVNSLIATGISFNREKLTARMRHLDRKLDQIERAGALSVQFADLVSESACARVFEHCLGLPHDSAWWARLAPVNLQINLASELRYVAAHGPQLRRAEVLCVREIRRLLRGDKPKLGPPDANGVTLQEEYFETAWRDARQLMSEHCVEVGETSDSYEHKNIALLQTLSDAGVLRVMTARINGRMFGYLSSVAGPSLEAPGEIVVNQLSLFVSKDAGRLGLGLKLQRAAIKAFETRGVKQVYMRAGVRGSGPRLSKLYEFIGAKDHGRMYRLDLGEAA